MCHRGQRPCGLGDDRVSHRACARMKAVAVFRSALLRGLLYSRVRRRLAVLVLGLSETAALPPPRPPQGQGGLAVTTPPSLADLRVSEPPGPPKSLNPCGRLRQAGLRAGPGHGLLLLRPHPALPVVRPDQLRGSCLDWGHAAPRLASHRLRAGPRSPAHSLRGDPPTLPSLQSSLHTPVLSPGPLCRVHFGEVD